MNTITMSQKIKALLQASNHSAKELAQYVNTNPSTVSHWQKNTTPSADYWPHIARFFGITVDDLLKEHPEDFLINKKINKENCKKSEVTETGEIREESKVTENKDFCEENETNPTDTIIHNKTFSEKIMKSLDEISEDYKLIQDTEELFSLFQKLDAWRRHAVLAYTYEQQDAQNQSVQK